MTKKYLVNEIYFTIHGEGVRYGIPHVFVRLAKCNLTCKFCDTEFESYTELTGEEIVAEAVRLTSELGRLPTDGKVDGQIRGGKPLPAELCTWMMMCGGEPLLQLDDELVKVVKDAGWRIAVETNGTRACPEGVDWICCSPKVAEHALKLKFAHELKYVRAVGQGIPHPRIKADNYLLSPMFDADTVDPKTMEWVANLVKTNPQWRLTIQHHKANFGGMR